MKMLEKVQKLWEQNKGKLISEDGKEARELIMARIEMARVALGEVYNKYNLDIELVVEQSKILLKRIGVKINSLNTDILVGAMQAWAKAVKQVEDGPAADIIAQFKKFTDSVEVAGVAPFSSSWVVGEGPNAQRMTDVSGEQIVWGFYPEPPLAHCSAEARDLIAGLLELDPEKRLSANQVLKHPWLAA